MSRVTATEGHFIDPPKHGGRHWKRSASVSVVASTALVLPAIAALGPASSTLTDQFETKFQGLSVPSQKSLKYAIPISRADMRGSAHRQEGSFSGVLHPLRRAAQVRLRGSVEVAPPIDKFEGAKLAKRPQDSRRSLGPLSEKGPKKGESNERQSSSTPSLFTSKLNYKTYSTGDGRPDGGFLGFAIPGQNWKPLDGKELQLNVSSKNERIKFSMHEAESSYQLDPAYVFDFAGQNFSKRNIFVIGSQNQPFLSRQLGGVAGKEQIEVKLIQLSLIGIAVFATHAHTDFSFQSQGFQNRVLAGRNGFAAVNGESVGAGAKIAFGPVSLTSQFSHAEQLVDFGAPKGKSQDHTVSINVEDASARLGIEKTGLLASIIPSSVYAGTFSGATVIRKVSDGPSATTKGLTTGATWGWDGGSADINYFDYSLDSHRFGDANYDSAGKGVSASLNAWTERISLSGGGSLTQANNQSPNLKDTSNYVSVFASSTLKLDTVPDVVVELNGFRYAYFNPGSNVRSENTLWSSSFGLDLSKYIVGFLQDGRPMPASSLNFKTSSLRALYRYQSGFDYISPERDSPTSHFMGLAFRTALY